MVSASVFQTDDAGSIPVVRSTRKAAKPKDSQGFAAFPFPRAAPSRVQDFRQKMIGWAIGDECRARRRVDAALNCDQTNSLAHLVDATLVRSAHAAELV